METLLAKINFKGYKRICVQNADMDFLNSLTSALPGTRIDRSVDPKFPYNFIVIFVKTIEEVDLTAHKAIHNLYEDGILWYVFPKETKETPEDAPTRKRGWNSCKDAGFEPVRQVCFNDGQTAIRFRNKKYIKRRNRS